MQLPNLPRADITFCRNPLLNTLPAGSKTRLWAQFHRECLGSFQSPQPPGPPGVWPFHLLAQTTRFRSSCFWIIEFSDPIAFFGGLYTLWVSRVCVWVTLVVSDSLKPHGLQLARLLCPWDSPGKNTAVGGHALLQGLNPHLMSAALAGGFFTTSATWEEPRYHLRWC